MPARRVHNDGTQAAVLTNWLLRLDWPTRHAYVNAMKRLTHRKALVLQIRGHMSPCELLDGLDSAIKYFSAEPIPLPNAQKRARQSTLEEFFNKKRRT